MVNSQGLTLATADCVFLIAIREYHRNGNSLGFV